MPGCSARLFGHTGRCGATFAFLDRSSDGSTTGWHADHANGDANDNRAANLRILCVPCHQKTPSYGRSIAAKLFAKPVTPPSFFPAPPPRSSRVGNEQAHTSYASLLGHGLAYDPLGIGDPPAESYPSLFDIGLPPKKRY
jgi:hypothetical protein